MLVGSFIAPVFLIHEKQMHPMEKMFPIHAMVYRSILRLWGV